MGKIAANAARNEILYKLWSEDVTIVQASSRTGIPTSTVGYYYKKFDRYSRMGRPIPIGTAAGNYQSTLTQASRDIQALKDARLKRKIDKLESQGRYAEVKVILDNEQSKRRLGLTEDPVFESLSVRLDPRQRALLKVMELSNIANSSDSESSYPVMNSQMLAANEDFAPVHPTRYIVKVSRLRDAKGKRMKDHKGNPIAKWSIVPELGEEPQLQRTGEKAHQSPGRDARGDTTISKLSGESLARFNARIQEGVNPVSALKGLPRADAAPSLGLSSTRGRGRKSRATESASVRRVSGL